MAHAKGKEQAQAQTEQAAQPQEQAPARREAARVPTPAGPRAELASPWRPGTAFRRLLDDFDRLFEDVQRGFFGPGLLEELPWRRRGLAEAEPAAWAPRIEVRDTPHEVLVTAELPGLDPKDVQIECTDEGIRLRGESRREEAREEEGVYRSERRYGAFYREIPLPPEIDVDKAQASYKNGLLTIRLPKTKEAQERVRRIPIGTEAGGEQGAGGGSEAAR